MVEWVIDVFWQFNVYTAQTNRTIQMLNDVWTSLVNEVEATKKCYKELEAAMMMTNDCLNDGISALDTRVGKCKDKHHTLCNTGGRPLFTQQAH